MEPITRKELFMAKAAGENVNVPEPITREEKYLAAIVASSGGGGSGEMVVNITAVATMDTGSTPQFVADKTFAEIAEAVTKAKFCRAVVDVGGELMFGFMNYAIPGEMYVFKFDEFIIAIRENEISFTPLS